MNRNPSIFALKPAYNLIAVTMKNRNTPLIALIIIALAFTFGFYGSVLLHPGDYLFSADGDGLKNYFTYNYQIRNNGSYTNFEGMNHPYGEHFMYTDSHPVFVLLLKPLAELFPSLALNSTGILNFLMIFSVLLTFIVVYFLLLELNIRPWFSLLFSIGIAMLAPQIFRLGGHLALSYSPAVPFSWFLMLRALNRNGEKRHYAYLLINNLFWFFIHAYLGMIVSFFLIVISLVGFLTDKKRKEHLSGYLKMLATLALPVVFFFAFVRITDTHTGRTNNPSGFFLYVAEADDVLVPNHPPLRPWLDSITDHGIRQQWEAWSYVGLFTSLLIVVFLFTGLYGLITRRRTFISGFFGNRLMNISLLAAFVVLLFAMAFPFRQLPALVDLMPVIKQFRALGRFTWPFFYAATAFSAWVVNQVYTNAGSRRTKRIAILMAFTALALNIPESWSYHREVSHDIRRNTNLFRKENLDADLLRATEAFVPSDYQAIIALPFFYQGSESYSRPGGSATTRLATLLSYHTRLPMVNANLTRTSVPESKKILQMVTPDYYPKAIAADLTDKRPFLIVRTADPVSEYELLLLGKCTPVFSSPAISMLKLEVDDLLSSGNHRAWSDFMARRQQLHASGSFLTSREGFLYYNGFDDRKPEKVFRGSGGFEAMKKGRNVLAEFAPGTFESGKEYNISAWMYNGHPDALNLYFRFMVEEYDEKQGTWTQTTCFPDQSETINGDWSMPEFSFRVNNPLSGIYIVTVGPRDARGPLYIDDLLIREKGMDVYREEGDFLFFNNHRIDLR